MVIIPTRMETTAHVVQFPSRVTREGVKVADHTARVEERLQLLLDVFGIPRHSESRWRDLAVSLAKEFVPGFRVVNQSGAPRLWSPDALMALRIEVETMARESGIKAMEACRRLLKNPDGTWRYPRCRSARSLYRRYQESKWR